MKIESKIWFMIRNDWCKSDCTMPKLKIEIKVDSRQEMVVVAM